MKRFLRDNGLTVVMLTLFALSLAGQILTGHSQYNDDQSEHAQPTVGLAEYLTTGHFVEATFENWESEFLQMGMYVLLTVKLRQRGSTESKPIDEPSPVDEDPAKHRDSPDAPWPVRRGGLWLELYKRSLGLAFFVLFAAAFLLHALTGSREYNNEQAAAGSTDRVSTWGYFGRAQFWFESLQNWQSEFLAVLAIVVLTIFLRQHGSPESKPVHAPHSQTGID